MWANGEVSPPDVRGCRVQGVAGAHSAAGSRGETRRLRSGIWTEAGGGSTRNVAGWAGAPHPAGVRSRVRVQLGTEHAGPPMRPKPSRPRQKVVRDPPVQCKEHSHNECDALYDRNARFLASACGFLQNTVLGPCPEDI